VTMNATPLTARMRPTVPAGTPTCGRYAEVATQKYPAVREENVISRMSHLTRTGTAPKTFNYDRSWTTRTPAPHPHPG
jgi:hypothetical protein